jgi:hypothetical protein
MSSSHCTNTKMKPNDPPRPTPLDFLSIPDTVTRNQLLYWKDILDNSLQRMASSGMLRRVSLVKTDV